MRAGRWTRWVLGLGVGALVALGPPAQAADTGVPTSQATPLEPGTPPRPCPEPWRGLLGRYGPSPDDLLIRERGGHLEVFLANGGPHRLEEVGPGAFRFAGAGSAPRTLVCRVDPSTGVARVAELDGTTLERRAGGVEGDVFRVTPRRPVAELRRVARAARPPAEAGPFRATDLVDVSALEPDIRLDVRYATSRNFVGTPIYPAERALLQRPAAEALVRAHRRLREHGYGLLVHDAYRPWWVTRLFWDATPPDKRDFVARPDRGSRHNRGAAVDLTLYRLADGRAVEMPGVYDEMSERSSADYPGGTSLQRWHRDLLRQAMEAEGFAVFGAEWWHYDHRDWRAYPILNVPFDAVPR